MRVLARRMFALLRHADANDVKYLLSLNLRKLNESKRPEGVEPRVYYQELQEKAKTGPIFDEKTIEFFNDLTVKMDKAEVQWLATNYQVAKGKLDLSKLGGVFDYLRAEKPELHGLRYDKALEDSIEWHEKFKGKEQATGPYQTFNEKLKCGELTWVTVPPEDCKVEGDLMGHCVGGYANSVRMGECIIYSLRDSKNLPHVTVEYTPEDKRFVQIQGKQNEQPIAKYHPAVDKLIQAVKPRFDQVTIPYFTDQQEIERILSSGPPGDDDYDSKAANDQIDALLRYNAHIKPETLQRYLNQEKVATQIAALRNPGLPPKMAIAHIKKFPKQLRYALHSSKPSLEIQKLAVKSNDSNILFVLSCKNNLDPKVAKELVAKGSARILARVVDNEQLPAEIFVRAYNRVRRDYKEKKNAASSVLRSLALNPNCPQSILERLGRSDDAKVLARVAENAKLSDKLIDLLMKHPDKYVRAHLAGNGEVPLDKIKPLLEDKSSKVHRYMLSREQNLPTEYVVKQASKSRDEFVLRRIAENDHSPTEALDIIWRRSKKGYVRRYCIKNPNASEKLLQRAADQVRYHSDLEDRSNLSKAVRRIMKQAVEDEKLHDEQLKARHY